MSDLIITTTTRESTANLAAAICAIWEADVDTPAVYAEACRIHNADLSHSVLAHTADGQFVGIGVLCRRGGSGFVLDFGVAPMFRRKGLGHQLFAALVQQMRAARLRDVSLLVSANNPAAQRIYQQAGFVATRELISLRGKMAAYAPGSAEERQTNLAATILAWFGAGRATRPQWERDLPSLLAMANVRGFENECGFLLARRSPYFQRIDIVHLALQPDAMPEQVNALLYAANVAFGPDLPLTLPEEPVNSRVYHKLTRLGFQPEEPMLEMQMILA